MEGRTETHPIAIGIVDNGLDLDLGFVGRELKDGGELTSFALYHRSVGRPGLLRDLGRLHCVRDGDAHARYVLWGWWLRCAGPSAGGSGLCGASPPLAATRLAAPLATFHFKQVSGRLAFLEVHFRKKNCPPTELILIH